MNTQDTEQAWEELVGRVDLVGKEVVFDNRVGSRLDKGKIQSIAVVDGYVVIESPEFKAEYDKGYAWSPNIKFKLNDERFPDVINGMVFCDLDDNRQIRITL